MALTMTITSCQTNNDALNFCYYENKIELTEAEISSIMFDDKVKLSKDEAVDIFNLFAEDNLTTRQNEPVIKITETKEYNISPSYKLQNQVNKSKLQCSIYELKINSTTGVYTAIISGDKRFPYVLAYFRNDSTSFSKELPPLLYSKELFTNAISSLDSNKDSLRNTTLEKIAKVLNTTPEKIEFAKIKEFISLKQIRNTRATITTPPSNTIAGNGPFIKVSWNDGLPYNQLMEQNCSDNWLWDYRYPISSVVIATAEIMSFYKPSIYVDGTRIDWDYLCEKEEIHDTSDYFGSYTKDPDDKCLMIAKLMKFIGEQCGVKYQCNSSSVNFSNIIKFLKKYGIYVDNMQKMNIATLKASVDELRPVFMYGQTSTGAGHWWIVDGYRTQPTTRASFFPGFNVYMHANMGKGKSYSGYYLVDSNGGLTFDTTFANFNTNLKMYPNVRND